MGKNKTIMLVDMDAFFVSVEEALNPKLRGKPVIVGGDPDGRGVVASASYKAREYGVRSAMPLAMARRLCPRAIFIKGSSYLYGEYSRRIMEILRRYTPAVEPVSVDEAYVDLTGCMRLHRADPVTLAQRARERIMDEVGVPASIGIASNKLTAKIAAEVAKPGGLLFIRPGYEASFIAPLPIGRMPGIGPSSEKVYRKMGIRVIGDLARFSPGALKRAFGKRARVLAARARGEDEREVTPDRDERKSIGRETTYSVDTSDPETLEATLSYLSESVGRRLRKSGLAFRRVTLKLRYEDFNTYTRSRIVDPPGSDTRTIFRTARSLMRGLYRRGARTRLIGVSVSSLTEPRRQISLFESRAELMRERLEGGMDEARDRFGFESVMLARSCLRSGLGERRRSEACNGQGFAPAPPPVSSAFRK